MEQSTLVDLISDKHQEKEQPFQPGDRVIALFGNEGKVHSISANGLFLSVKFDNFDSLVVFNIDGRASAWHKEPSIKRIEDDTERTENP